MEARLQLRAAAALGVLVVAFGGLVCRLWDIQITQGEAFAEQGRRQYATGRLRLAAERGTITDRHGHALARTEQLPSLAVDPKYVREEDEVDALDAILRDELGLDVRGVVAAAAPSAQFVWLRRKVADRDAVARIGERARVERIGGLIVTHEPVRTYPAGDLAAHLVGFAFEDATQGLRGAEGAERLADPALRGRDGWLAAERDVRGRAIVRGSAEIRPPASGHQVRLTIDSVVQAFAEEEAERVWVDFAPRSCVAAVLDVRTGELLAAACRPNFDPNDRGASAESRSNVFFGHVFEPGSSFKPVAMAIALDAGCVDPTEVIDTSPGTLRVGRRTIREDKHKDYGALTPTGILAHSSNVGMSIIALRIGIPRMHAGVRLFGFGAGTGVGWSGESGGLVRRIGDWTEAYTLCSVSFGQEIATTPAQLLSAYGALANDGVLRPLRILCDTPERAPVRVVRPETAQRLVPMLEEVYRTGTAARIDTGGYRLGGKTGTAEQKSRDGGVAYVGSFACIGPIGAERLAVLVVCDRPTNGTPYGSRVAAPHATRLMLRALRYLGVPARPRRTTETSTDPADRILEVNPR